MQTEYYLDIEVLNFTQTIRNMSSQKVTNQTSALNAVKHRFYIVGSVDMYGNIGFSNTPAIHTTESSAKAEAERLALTAPGKAFIYVQFKGGAIANQVTQL